MKKLSDIACGIAPSATLAIDALAKQMKAEGIDVAAFGAGEPDFNTPDNIKQAGIQAILDNKTRYTPAAGLLMLRQAICDHIRSVHNLPYTPDNIVVTSGAKHAIYIALHAMCDPGDEVLLPAPYWVSYYEAIRSCGAVPVIMPTTEEDRFKISPQALREAITDKTKCLILCNPSNPTGVLYSREEQLALAEVVLEKDIYVISDEIYSALTYVGEFVSFPSLGKGILEHVISIRGVSKAYAMTGWRLGYAVADLPIAKVMASYVSHSTSAPSTISQYAAYEAYTGDQTTIEAMRLEFDNRRRYFLQRAAAIPGIHCVEPDGAFYIFMNIQDQLGRTFFGEKVETSAQFAASLLKNALVAVVPGSAFGMEGYLRWSYATDLETIEKGLTRLAEFVKQGS